MPDPLIVRIIAVGFSLLFLLSAVHKLTAFREFQAILADYRVVPNRLTAALAGFVAVTELLLGLGWLFSGPARIVTLGSAGLLVSYTVAISLNLYRGRIHISCGCNVAGDIVSDQTLSPGLVIRNLVMIALVIVAMLPAGERSLSYIDYLTLATAILASICLYAASNQLLGNNAAINSWRKRRD